MERIYLDNAATTRVNEEVAEKVKEVFLENYGNASSLHEEGKRAGRMLEEARKKIAKFVGCDVSEIIFTSGGTESNNLALRGLAKANPDKKHIVTSAIEHPSILETCKDLEENGFDVDYIGVDSEGLVSVDEIKSKIRDNTLVVSIMHVNNEIGTIQPIGEISKICRKRSVYFHTDAVQSFKKIEIPDVDLFSVSGHKFHAPKGIGFLYVKKGVIISPIFEGGGQESGLRSGTENIPGIVGIATALDVNFKKKEILKSRNKIIGELKNFSGARINGSIISRIWNNINVSFYGIEGESLMLMLDKAGISVSTGSACASTKLSESYVLKAIGVDEMYIHGSLRLSLGEDILGREDYVVENIYENVKRLREISPFKFREEGNDG